MTKNFVGFNPTKIGLSPRSPELSLKVVPRVGVLTNTNKLCFGLRKKFPDYIKLL